MKSKVDPVLKIAVTANLFEWYAFSLTAFMALEIGKLFFPPASDKTALLLSFSVFACSYLARPLGSLLFGAIGNRYGTGAALKVSMIGMAVPASLISFLPTYATAGFVATGLLIALKLVQGFAAGGEVPLSGYFVSLNAATKVRGIYCALVVVSGFLGMLLASAVVFVLPYCVAMLQPLTSQAVAARLPDPWRWPFLLCIPLSIWIYSLRSSITPEPDRGAHRGSHSRPALPLIQAFILVAFIEAHIYTVFVWLPKYLHSYLGAKSFDAQLTNVITLIIFCASVVGAGYVARFKNPAHLSLTGILLLTCSTYPLFAMLQRTDLAVLLAVQAAFAVMAGLVVGVIFLVVPDLFKDNWKSLGMASTYSIATAVFGGTAPIVGAYLIKVTNLVTAPALYIVALGIVAAPVAYSVSLRYRAETSIRVGPCESGLRSPSSSIPLNLDR